ncbi:MAG: hypothetical protein Q7T74_03735 [Candidatus Saccharibacteria bacterium]|nr:hypothetical protein [Candidatus Saccharibacteria bacterium]
MAGMTDIESFNLQINENKDASDLASIAVALAEYHMGHPISIPLELRDALGNPTSKELEILLGRVASMMSEIADERHSSTRFYEKLKTGKLNRLKNNSAA